MTAIFSVQNTDNSHHHVVCVQNTVLTVMLYVQNTDKQNTDNSHLHVVCPEHRQFAQTHINVVSAEHRQFCHVECAEHRQTDHRQFSPSCCVSEHRQFSLSCCVCRSQTIVIVMLCVQNTNRTQTSLTVMLCVKNTDNSHRHVVCAEHRQTEHRQFSPSCCVQNTDKENTDNSHCHFVRAEHSWAVVWTRPSAVPTTPCGNCSSRTERGTSTVCDTAACWSVGTDPSRLLWHQDGQTLTQ